MRSFLIQLSEIAGDLALEHFRALPDTQVSAKGRGDYVSHVDHRVEDALVTRIRQHYPDHLVLGEESHREWPRDVAGPCWIIDPIDGTTNYVRGLPGWAISIAFCDDAAEPRHAVVFDPLRRERFLGERGAGVWLDDRRVSASSCPDLDRALIATSLPFRDRSALDEVAAVMLEVQRRCDDVRRSGCASLDLAYVAVGRLDAYYELGIQPWDTAAGELLVRGGGGVVSDFTGRGDGLLGRRSVVAAATGSLHRALLERVQALTAWLDHPAYAR